MRTIGADVASASTGMCVIDWDRLAVVALRAGRITPSAAADRIRSEVDAGGWAAVDAPFGFPAAFGEAVTAMHAGLPVPAPRPAHPLLGGGGPAWRRITDAVVQQQLTAALRSHNRQMSGESHWPLSSVTDQITGTAYTWAVQRHRIAGPSAADLVGYGTRIVEVYPAASLLLWGAPRAARQPSRLIPYKTDSAATRLMAEWVAGQVPWLSVGPSDMALLARSDDAIDALIAALTAKLAADPSRPTCPCRTVGVDRAARELIAVEGWIHLPPAGHSIADLAAPGRDGVPAPTSCELCAPTQATTPT